MATEDKFPTIKDVYAALASLIERGLGDLAVQIVVAPDSTLQAIARNSGWDGKPAMMIDLAVGVDGRLPASIIATERLGGRDHPTTSTQ